MDQKKLQELVANCEGALNALKNAMGQNKYTDGEAVGNPVQSYDDKIDEGNEGRAEKVKMFAARAKRMLG